jgi:hypothetical protein
MRKVPKLLLRLDKNPAMGILILINAGRAFHAPIHKKVGENSDNVPFSS